MSNMMVPAALVGFGIGMIVASQASLWGMREDCRNLSIEIDKGTIFEYECKIVDGHRKLTIAEYILDY